MDSKVTITALAHGGSGVGRIDGKVVFVPFTAPGDEAMVEITAGKKTFSEGVLKEIITPSPMRATPECGLYGVCGGCSLQHIGYQGQVEWKQRIFEETLRRIGGISDVAFDPAVSTDPPMGYRSRARFHVSGGVWGFFEVKSHRVASLEACPVLDPLINTAFAAVRDALKGADLSIFAVDIGVSEADNMAVASIHVTSSKGFPWAEALSGVKVLKGYQVLVYPVRQDRNRGRLIERHGDTELSYQVEDMRLGAGIDVFSQVNRRGNRFLVEKVLSYASLEGTESVVDLFSGVGNLSLPLARRAGSVVGVESAGEAVEAAIRNGHNNSVSNADFITMDASAWLKQEMKTLEKKRPDVVVLDPPRGGDTDVASMLGKIRPARIIYVSCSPPTLARDLSHLIGTGYTVKRAGLIDMFPQTFHIEGVVVLDAR